MNNETTKETTDWEMLEDRREAEIQIAAKNPHPANLNALYLRHLVLPTIFLTVTLLGGLRIAGSDGAFVFFRPALVCLIFGAILLVLFAATYFAMRDLINKLHAKSGSRHPVLHSQWSL